MLQLILVCASWESLSLSVCPYHKEAAGTRAHNLAAESGLGDTKFKSQEQSVKTAVCSVCLCPEDLQQCDCTLSATMRQAARPHMSDAIFLLKEGSRLQKSYL